MNIRKGTQSVYGQTGKKKKWDFLGSLIAIGKYTFFFVLSLILCHLKILFSTRIYFYIIHFSLK
jgi:hypothetical protein